MESMEDGWTPDDLEIHVHGAGGAGRGALWKWGVYVKSRGAIEDGEVKGARSKAQAAAEEALQRITLAWHRRKNAR